MKEHRAQLHRNSPRLAGARIAGALLALTLWGCASAPVSTPAGSAPRASVQQLLDKAHASALDMRAPYLLDAAALALQDKQIATAMPILREIDSLQLSTAQHARRQLLAARLALLQNRPEQAIAALQDRRLAQALDQLTASEQIDVSLLRAQAFHATGNYFASAQERVFVDPLLSAAQTGSNHQEIRRALDSLSSADLQRHRAAARSDALRGWLDLAIAARKNRPSPSQAASSAITAPAGNSVSFEAISAEHPQQVALLLPLTGKLAAFGEAVRDGFFAALYAAQQRGEQVPAVRVYDSDATGIVQLYLQAVSDGAGAVIGPLEKLQVAQFYPQALPVPLLALNRADHTEPPPANLYQFSLAPEDETATLAQLIAQDRKRNLLVVANADEMASREAQTFLQSWQSAGGNIAGKALFRSQGELSTAIRNALNLPRSEARGREIESILNRKIEFTPHRRRDVDAVLMLAKPGQARAIKPLLNFYYAGDLPVYSTSRIYSGYASGALDHDLEGVRFTEIPWILHPSSQKQQIVTARPGAKNFLRLYALGIDSFNLYPRLRQLESSGGSRVEGQTGVLSLDAQRVVRREMVLAQMRNGSAEPSLDAEAGSNARESFNVAPEPDTH